ncbi:MAG TPA: M1 family peptidase [Caldithrix abyssi]|uniref:M1 family peptidase n=1 Tax=Caldithrix abyssi TaxID=187145 RepID=A0A7V4WVY6_CALAY|nr:M1 family peptidase [Caldithrix abyssi]
MRTLLLVVFITGLLTAGEKTSLYMPLNIQKAYKNQTRSWDGQPGPNYWINRSVYQIDVRFHPQQRLIEGEEQIVYYNESPDTLKEIVLRLYQDFFKKGNARDWSIGNTDLHNGVRLKAIAVNDSSLDLEAEESPIKRGGTNVTIPLSQPLLSGGRVHLAVNWSLTISDTVNMRMGTYDSTSFFIGYWYPQIAVYDDIDGWDRFNFSGMQEFYNDANDYDVRITVPAGFVVWATGVLQNAEDLFTDKILKRYKQARNSDAVVKIIRPDDLEEGQILESYDSTVWHYKAKRVPDFAFALSDHYLWDASSLVVDKETGRRTFIGAAYKESSKDFQEVALIARQSIDYFSNEMPGVPYPYPEMTVFNGKGGMEYPMMVNDGSTSKRSGTVHLTSHEIAHSYFPFYMGTNERKYAWMDEGWAVMLPFKLQHRLVETYDPIARNTATYERYAGHERELEMMTPSIVFGSNAFRPTYRTHAYNRPAQAYYFLQDILGDSLFSAAMKEYIARWHQKHPIPYDFFFTFDRVAGEDLSWYWKPWFFEKGYPDLAIKDVFEEEGNLQVLIQRIGNLPVPVNLVITYEDDSSRTLYKTARVWQNGDKGITIKLKNGKAIRRIELGSKHIPDVDKTNNTYVMKRE